MGVKFKKSVASKERNTKKITVSHYWISGMSIKELLECVAKESTRPKQRQKVKNELTKRGESYEQNSVNESSENKV